MQNFYWNFLLIFSRRRKLRHARDCHPSHPLVSDLHQFSLQKDLHQDHSRFLTCDNGNSVNGMFSCTMDKSSNNGSGVHKSLTAVTALTRNGQTMTRCCGNLEAHFQRHYNGSNPAVNQANSLPNHYIPDQPALQRLTEVRPRLSVPDRTVMELSERPPQLRPPNVIPPNAYPHIIIGGKPFYLIPSSGEALNNDAMFDSYSYPQHVPIYEEIDGGSRFYEAASEMDFSSEQGEVGSVERLAHNVDISRSPRLFRHILMPGDATPQHHRPVSSATSHSQNSSQQTNTSEISSSSSSTASTSNPNLSHHHHHHHQQLQQQQQQHYVVLDADLEEVKKKQNSFSSLYENSNTKPKSPKLNRSGVRLADGIERSRSPQSIYSARLATKSVSQCSSPNRSVYYYSDTMKRDSSSGRQEPPSQTTIKEGEEDIFNSDNSIELDNSFSKQVETVIVLDDPKTKTTTATLVWKKHTNFCIFWCFVSFPNESNSPLWKTSSQTRIY